MMIFILYAFYVAFLTGIALYGVLSFFNAWPLSQVLRWVFIASLSVASFIGIALYGRLNICFDYVEFRLCTQTDETAFIALSAFIEALAAALVMITCVLLAPTHKRQVAILTFVLGAMSAILMSMAMGRGGLVPIVPAIVSGAIVLAMLLRRLPPLSLPNTSLERPRER
ncbi:MAG: hypothetical protein NTV65_01900 [Proteobacteria bacterium]|nr:hypothetical protein [Pseudomonadota bacterium]